ncbi:hypothetical protein [Marinitoga litoralis]|uniref:hypothetical protein n=1 Tax=Marinitoga litoralis TaxID=570855 RepID=UPI00196185A1|nr:hypothetical protein [Marinitoga litoralis]MBM7559479.1 hypothetical protein [Marinitoga litoralis]
MKDFKQFLFFSLITFLVIFSLFIVLNLKYIERTVEDLVSRSSLSVYNIINSYNSKYKNIINTFSNDLFLSTKLYYFEYILNNDLDNIFNDNQYKDFEKHILEKKELTQFKGEIIISDFNGNIFYPKYTNIKNYTLYEKNISSLEKGVELVKISPIFNIERENYAYISTYVFHINNIPIGYITLETRIDFDNLKDFNIDNLNFYIIDKDTKLIWPKISLPYFIYSKIFLSNKTEEKIKFNGKYYYLKKTNFGNNLYLLSIFENKMLERYILIYFILISLFITSVIIFWMRRYVKFENNISEKLVNIANELEINDSDIISEKIKNIKFILNTLFKEVNTFEEIENKILDALRVYDDIIFVGFYSNNELYEVYNSGKYNITNEILDILKNTKKIYEFPISSNLLGFDKALLIKESEVSTLEKEVLFDGIKQLIYDYYIKINKIYDYKEFGNYYYNYNFKNVIIVKFQDEFNLKSIDIFKSYIFKKDNNLLFLNTFNKKVNEEIIESLEIYCELNNIEAKIILFNIPKYESKKKKLIKEIERVLSHSFDEIESSY